MNLDYMIHTSGRVVNGLGAWSREMRLDFLALLVKDGQKRDQSKAAHDPNLICIFDLHRERVSVIYRTRLTSPY